MYDSIFVEKYIQANIDYTAFSEIMDLETLSLVI